MAVTGPGSHIQASQLADPCRVADVTLAAAVRAPANAVHVEPLAMADDAYAITPERAAPVLTTVAVDAPLGSAGIARGLIGFTPALESV